jgi:hypothetical protein
MTISEWLSLFGSISTVGASIVAGWIAHRIGTSQIEVAKQQAKTSENKLRLDLFDRRLEVFRRLKDHVSEAKHTGDFTSDNYRDFLADASAAQWVFDRKIHDYLILELLPEFDELHYTFMIMKDLQRRPDGQEVVNRRDSAYADIRAQQRHIEEVFGPYLQLQT